MRMRKGSIILMPEILERSGIRESKIVERRKRKKNRRPERLVAMMQAANVRMSMMILKGGLRRWMIES